MDEGEAPFDTPDASGEGRKPSFGGAAKRLHLDDVGAEIRQQPARVGPGHVSQLHHPKVGQRGGRLGAVLQIGHRGCGKSLGPSGYTWDSRISNPSSRSIRYRSPFSSW